MKWAILTALCVLCLLLAMDISLRIFAAPPDWKPIDAVTAMLGGLAVMLAIVTIFLGIAAILGYFHIRDIAVQAAKDVAKTAAEEVATRAIRELSDQEDGQGGGDEYARGAAGPNGDGPASSGS
ncbi:hypothetical protein ACT6QG_05435 [Xanthobacter sp. TB0136]|uniref:hypothetical protein n=1 Tax=Xanthobacter sp. TB0136 TaxID=3459177 RepID=UPI00403A0271